MSNALRDAKAAIETANASYERGERTGDRFWHEHSHAAMQDAAAYAAVAQAEALERIAVCLETLAKCVSVNTSNVGTFWTGSDRE